MRKTTNNNSIRKQIERIELIARILRVETPGGGSAASARFLQPCLWLRKPTDDTNRDDITIYWEEPPEKRKQEEEDKEDEEDEEENCLK